MKKSILMPIIALTCTSYASTLYNVIITKEHNEYDGESYWETGNVSCEVISPLNEEIYKDRDFVQNHSNCEKELTNGISITKWISHPDFTTNEKGTLLLSSCKEILDNGYSLGDKDYQAIINGSELTLTCDMTTSGGGWTKLYSRYFVDVENGPTRNDMLEHIIRYGDLNASDTMFDLENRWFVMYDIDHSEFDWMWNSGNGHEYRNLASSVDTSIGVTYEGSEVVWSHWRTVIYQLNRNSGTWDSDVIFDLGYDGNHGPAFWDNADGVYKRLDGYQSPENVTLSIWAR